MGATATALRGARRWCLRPPARALLSALALACLALCSPVAAQASSEGTARTVSKVTIGPTSLVPASAVRDYLAIREGQTIDKGGLPVALGRLEGLDLFSKVTGTAVDLPDGTVEVRVEVEERVLLTAVRFRGNSSISDERLSAVAGIQQGQAVTPQIVRAAEGRITDAYGTAGYPLVSVAAYVETRRKDERVLVLDVLEGPESRIRTVEITGNAAFSRDEVIREMHSRARRWPSFLGRGRFEPQVFRDDLQAIEKAYHERGYLDAQVGGHWSYGQDFGAITLHVAVYEGPLYTVAAVRFDGNNLFRDDEFLEAIPLEVGAPLLLPQLDEARQVIADMYGRQGYVDVGSPRRSDLAEELLYDRTGATVTVVFHIVEGQLVRIRQVRIEGLTKTRDSVVRRELTIFPGQRARTDRIAESQRLLRNTSYFDFRDPTSVAITLEPEQGAERDAVVRVKEGQTGYAMLLGGVGAEAGLMGRLILREDNFDIANPPRSWKDIFGGNAFRGGGQRLALEATVATNWRSLVLSFDEPSYRDGPYGYGGELYLRSDIWDEFVVRRIGLAPRLTRKLNRYTTAALGLGYEDVKMHNLDADAPPEIVRDKGSYSKPYLFASLQVDRRDNQFLPSQGHLLRVDAELAGADIETFKLVGEARKYWTVWEPQWWGKHILATRGRAGILWGYGGRVPVFERFYAGGSDSLRGFEPRGVSPIEPIGGKQVGGQSLLLGSVEYSVPLIGDSVRLAAFTDAGYVREKVGDILSGWDDLRVSTGLGIRWSISFLGNTLLTADLGFPIRKEEGDETQTFSFSIGASRRF